MKFIVGKRYPLRSGDTAVYRGLTSECSPGNAFAASHPFWFHHWNGTPFSARGDGSQGACHGRGGYDILSDTPIDEPLQLEAGKRYRRRDGEITGPLEDNGAAYHPSSRFFDPEGERSYFFTGCYRDTPGTSSLDLIELYEDPKEQPMTAKRSLPTVSLDDIFKKEPCWIAQMGPVAAAKKMTEMVPEGKVSLRTLNHLVMTERINAAEADWVDEKTGLSRDYDGPRGRGSWGSDFAKHLDNWENPKPKPRTLADLKPGSYFTHGQDRFLVLERNDHLSAFLAHHPEEVPVLVVKESRVSYFTGSTALTRCADIVEPGSKPVVQKAFSDLKTGDCFKFGGYVFLRTDDNSGGAIAVTVSAPMRGVTVLKDSLTHHNLLTTPVVYLPNFVLDPTP